MEQMSIFENKISQPLAARLRPATLEEYVGQTHLLGEGKVSAPPYRKRQPFLYDFLGSSGHRKDDAGQDNRRYDKSRIHRFFCGDQRHQGNKGGDAAGRDQPPLRRKDRRFRG